MDTYFFDSSAKALVKWCFLLITYFSSILLKQFSSSVILPTVFIYLLSNLTDYVELAFMKQSKSRAIKIMSFFFSIILAAASVFIFSAYSTTNATVDTFLSKHYWIIYVFCAIVWLIPLIDGVRSFFDKNQKNAVETSNELQSSVSFDAMTQSIINK